MDHNKVIEEVKTKCDQFPDRIRDAILCAAVHYILNKNTMANAIALASKSHPATQTEIREALKKALPNSYREYRRQLHRKNINRTIL